MRIGFDVDGVLANFYLAYEGLHIAVGGENRFPPLDDQKGPYAWNWPTDLHGYTKPQSAEVWRRIKADPQFWRRLRQLPDFEDLRAWLKTWPSTQCEFYFITDRAGVLPVRQTQDWFTDRGVLANIVVSGEKGKVASLLKLDCYIDDKWENCVDTSAVCSTYLVDRNYNRPNGADQPAVDKTFGIRRIERLRDFLTEINGMIYGRTPSAPVVK